MKEGLPIRLELSDNFYEADTRNGYLITAEMKKIWAVELDLLHELDRVCRKNDITYYVDSGTLLGAIRHKGFIPWDDDADVIITRKEYERLCAVAQREFKSPYFFQTEYSDPGTLRGHAQLRNSLTTAILRSEKELGCRFNQGIFLDVFVIDYLPDDPDERAELKNKAAALMEQARRENVRVRANSPYDSAVMKLYHGLTHLASRMKKSTDNPYFVQFEELLRAQLPSMEMTKMSLYINNATRPIRSEWLGRAVYVPFEEMMVPVPEQYERLLETYYFKNWKVPLMADNAHGGVIFDAEKPYTEYLK